MNNAKPGFFSGLYQTPAAVIPSAEDLAPGIKG